MTMQTPPVPIVVYDQEGKIVERIARLQVKKDRQYYVAYANRYYPVRSDQYDRNACAIDLLRDASALKAVEVSPFGSMAEAKQAALTDLIQDSFIDEYLRAFDRYARSGAVEASYVLSEAPGAFNKMVLLLAVEGYEPRTAAAKKVLKNLRCF